MVKWLFALFTLLFSIQNVVRCISNKRCNKWQSLISQTFTQEKLFQKTWFFIICTCQNTYNKKTCPASSYKGPPTHASTAQKMKFSIKDFLSKCHQRRSFLQIWSHLLKKYLMENFIFCAVFKLIITGSVPYAFSHPRCDNSRNRARCIVYLPITRKQVFLSRRG